MKWLVRLWIAFWLSIFALLAVAGTGQISVLDSGSTARLYDVVTDTTSPGCSGVAPCFIAETLSADQSISTGLSSTGTVTLTPLNGASVVNIVASGTGTGLTFNIQLQDPSGAWSNVVAYASNFGLLGTGGASFSGNGGWSVLSGGYQAVRVNLTAISGGTETFSLRASSGLPNGLPVQIVGGSSTVQASVNASGQLAVAVNNHDYQNDPGTNGFTQAPFSVLTTELNSLASAGVATSSVNGTSGVFNQTNTGSDQFGRCWITLGGALGGTASAGANFSIWFLTSTDGGTTFESQTVSPPPRAPDIVIPVGANAYGANAVLMSPPKQNLWLESVKIVFQNNTGQAMAASGNVVKCAGESVIH